MKTNKFLIASLLILVAMGAITMACEKEKSCVRKAMMVVETTNEKGGDDQDPIIRVRVKKRNTLAPVDSAFVETINYNTNIRVNFGYTDSHGEYDRQVASGIYYFRVTAPSGGTSYVTDTLHVNKDVLTTILID